LRCGARYATWRRTAGASQRAFSQSALAQSRVYAPRSGYAPSKMKSRSQRRSRAGIPRLVASSPRAPAAAKPGNRMRGRLGPQSPSLAGDRLKRKRGGIRPPVQVRVYLLKNDGRLKNAKFDEIWQGDKDALQGTWFKGRRADALSERDEGGPAGQQPGCPHRSSRLRCFASAGQDLVRELRPRARPQDGSVRDGSRALRSVARPHANRSGRGRGASSTETDTAPPALPPRHNPGKARGD